MVCGYDTVRLCRDSMTPGLAAVLLTVELQDAVWQAK